MKSRSALLLLALGVLGCDQLGNPPQYATGPTKWQDGRGHLVTQTRSFKNENTIRRLAAEGMEGFDYADPSIGPSQTLTVVVVVPRTLRADRRRNVRLVTTFKMAEGRPIVRRWSAPLRSEKWTAAFALPAPPEGAVTSVAP